MSKYTREQVIDMATNVRDCAWPADVKEYMVLIEPMLRAYAATLSQQDAPAERMGMCFETPDDLANWLESLHAMTEDGAVTGEKWESAQIAAHAIRNMDKLGKVAHFDDVAVNFFADAMKLKLAEAREKGRGGWDGDEPGMQQRLSDMLRNHVAKGDPLDVGNFAMFLHQRGESILPAQNTQDEGKCSKCGAPTDPDCGHVGECHTEGIVVPDEMTQQVFREDDPERFGYVRGFNACRDLVLAALSRPERTVVPK